MKITVLARDPLQVESDLLAVPLPQLDPAHWRLPARVAAIDRALGGIVSARVGAGDFRGRAKESLLLFPRPDASGVPRLLLLGMGSEERLDAEAVRRAAGRAVASAAERRLARVTLLLPTSRRVRAAAAAQAAAEGALLASFRADAYRTEREEEPGEVESLTLVAERASEVRAARAGVHTGVVLAEAQNLARRLSNEPANALPPAALADEARRLARSVGLGCRVLDPPELRRRKMGALLAVGQGSSHPPRLIVLEHNAPPRRGGRRPGATRRRPTVCVVGKGITFDSGGISIKPGAGMQDMKHDMSGAAAVLGILRAAALLRIPLHVVGIVAAAENLPSATAYRPGDVVTSMSGKTIEVLNTDAEGRLVLADALHFARSEFEPQALIDLATLTGACVVALGRWASGLFGNHERLLDHLRRAGEASGERVWPLPVWEEHREHMRSRFADLRNVGGREAGAVTAAAFLSCFVGETPWAHIDIAGTAWTDKPNAYQPHGATGVGVRLVTTALRGWREARPVQ